MRLNLQKLLSKQLKLLKMVIFWFTQVQTMIRKKLLYLKIQSYETYSSLKRRKNKKFIHMKHMNHMLPVYREEKIKNSFL